MKKLYIIGKNASKSLYKFKDHDFPIGEILIEQVANYHLHSTNRLIAILLNFVLTREIEIYSTEVAILLSCIYLDFDTKNLIERKYAPPDILIKNYKNWVDYELKEFDYENNSFRFRNTILFYQSKVVENILCLVNQSLSSNSFGSEPKDCVHILFLTILNLYPKLNLGDNELAELLNIIANFMTFQGKSLPRIRLNILFNNKRDFLYSSIEDKFTGLKKNVMEAL